jgi:hypothetical protein
MDLKSTQGTFVAGKRITPFTPVKLEEGTQFIVGASTRVFKVRGPAPSGEAITEHKMQDFDYICAKSEQKLWVSGGPPKKRKWSETKPEEPVEVLKGEFEDMSPESTFVPSAALPAEVTSGADDVPAAPASLEAKLKAMTPQARERFYQSQRAEKDAQARKQKRDAMSTAGNAFVTAGNASFGAIIKEGKSGDEPSVEDLYAVMAKTKKKDVKGSKSLIRK